MSGGAAPRLELPVSLLLEVLAAGPAVPRERVIRSVSIDSRTLLPDALFVPLPGSRVDGHEFIGQALERGAAAVLVSRSRAERLPAAALSTARRTGAALVPVEDTLAALQRLGRWHLDRSSPTVRIGITGSSGKTTTKELLAACLRCEAPTAASRGNLNSEIGLPLSCFEVSSRDRFAVFEMGVNHPGEMDVLVDIVRPDLAVVTNIGTAHIGLMGSREAIAGEKIKIAKHFDGRQTAFLWEDDDFLGRMTHAVRGRVVTFGPHSTKGFEGSEDLGLDGTIVRWEGLRIRFPLFGSYNLVNALAALSVSAELGISRSSIRQGLETVEALFGRSQIFRGAVTVLQDGYNANPESLGELCGFLAGLSWPGRKLLVLGSMKELGGRTEEAHRAAGRLAGRAGADRVLLFGEEMRWAYEEMRDHPADGVDPETLFWTADFDELAARLQGQAAEGDLIVLKGSRAMELERLLDRLPVRGAHSTGAAATGADASGVGATGVGV